MVGHTSLHGRVHKTTQLCGSIAARFTFDSTAASNSWHVCMRDPHQVLYAAVMFCLPETTGHADVKHPTPSTNDIMHMMQDAHAALVV